MPCSCDDFGLVVRFAETWQPGHSALIPDRDLRHMLRIQVERLLYGRSSSFSSPMPSIWGALPRLNDPPAGSFSRRSPVALTNPS